MSEINERLEQWLNLPDVPGSGLLTCAVCGWTKKTRWSEDCGDVCHGCYVNNVKCSVAGCDCLAVEDGLCRAHWVGQGLTDEEMRERDLEGVWGKEEPTYPPAAPAHLGWIQMRKKMREVAAKNGIRVKMSPFLSSPIYYRGAK